MKKLNKQAAAHFSIPPDTAVEIHDLRDYEAPIPMEIILMKCAKLEDNNYFLVHLPHVPTPLFPHLASRGLNWETLEKDDGGAVVLIRRIP